MKHVALFAGVALLAAPAIAQETAPAPLIVLELTADEAKSAAALVSAANSVRLIISAPPQFFVRAVVGCGCVSVPAPLTAA